MKTIAAYKGFKQDMTCRGFQYEEGKEYREEAAKLCERGFHACLDPIDCFVYYPPSNSVYHEVIIGTDDNDFESEEEDTKICGTYIKIGKRLSMEDIAAIHAGMCKDEKSIKTAQDYSSLSAQGHSSLSARNYSSLSAQGFSSLSAQGHSSLSARNYSSLSAQDFSSLSAGKNSVISAINSIARAGLGSIITLAKVDGDDIVDFKAGVVDGVNILPDVWYKVENGEFVEVVDEELKQYGSNGVN